MSENLPHHGLEDFMHKPEEEEQRILAHAEPMLKREASLRSRALGHGGRQVVVVLVEREDGKEVAQVTVQTDKLGRLPLHFLKKKFDRQNLYWKDTTLFIREMDDGYSNTAVSKDHGRVELYGDNEDTPRPASFVPNATSQAGSHCDTCGHPPPDAKKLNFCTNCGHKIELPGGCVCSSCGHRLWPH